MKKINLKLMIALIGGSLIMASCGNNSNPENDTHHHEEGMEHDHSNHEHGSTDEKRNVSANTGEMKGDLSVVLSHYFAMNESLVKDDASSAQKSGEQLKQALESFKGIDLSEKEQNEVNEILESAIENAEHIAKSEIDHQREHLIVLSVDLKDLIAIIGSSQKLYEAYCPMANNNEGAIWISNKEEISNPYMGSSMPKCGKVNRVIE
jgi:hypothetical protein